MPNKAPLITSKEDDKEISEETKQKCWHEDCTLLIRIIALCMGDLGIMK